MVLLADKHYEVRIQRDNLEVCREVVASFCHTVGTQLPVRSRLLTNRLTILQGIIRMEFGINGVAVMTMLDAGAKD